MKTFEMTQKMMKKMQDGKSMKKMMKGLNQNDLKNFRQKLEVGIQKITWKNLSYILIYNI